MSAPDSRSRIPYPLTPSPTHGGGGTDFASLPLPREGEGAGGWGVLPDLALYGMLIRAQVSAQLQYRASFVVQAVGQFLVTFTDFIMLLLLFQRFPSIAGWTLGEVAFLYGMGGLAFGISDLLCGGFDSLSKMIRLGT